MPVGELDELFPIVGIDRVAAGADVVADVAIEQRLVGGRQLGDGERLFAEQPIHRGGVVRGLELTVRIGPRVRRGAGDVHRPRGDEREQHVLIQRQVVLSVVEFAGVDAEPVGEAVDFGHRLAELAPPQRRAAAAGLGRDGQREPLVLRSRPKRGLTHF